MKVWAFGQNTQGQCTGDSSDGIKISTPFEVQIKYNDDQTRLITKICGTCFSSLILSKPVDAQHGQYPIAKIEKLRKLKMTDFPSSIDFSELDILCKQIEDEECDITYDGNLDVGHLLNHLH